MRLHRGDQFAFRFAREQAVFHFAGGERRITVLPRRPLHVRQSPRRHCGNAAVANLALLDQIVERAQGFFERHGGIKAMQLVDVDPVGLEPLEARFNRLRDVTARRALHQTGIVHRVAEFRREHDVLAPRAEKLAEADFRAALVAVDIGGVEEGDAEIERLVDHRARGIGVDAQPEVIAAQPDGGELERRVAELALFHRALC